MTPWVSIICFLSVHSLHVVSEKAECSPSAFSLTSHSRSRSPSPQCSLHVFSSFSKQTPSPDSCPVPLGFLRKNAGGIIGLEGRTTSIHPTKYAILYRQLCLSECLFCHLGSEDTGGAGLDVPFCSGMFLVLWVIGSVTDGEPVIWPYLHNTGKQKNLCRKITVDSQWDLPVSSVEWLFLHLCNTQCMQDQVCSLTLQELTLSLQHQCYFRVLRRSRAISYMDCSLFLPRAVILLDLRIDLNVSGEQ